VSLGHCREVGDGTKQVGRRDLQGRGELTVKAGLQRGVGMVARSKVTSGKLLLVISPRYEYNRAFAACQATAMRCDAVVVRSEEWKQVGVGFSSATLTFFFERNIAAQTFFAKTTVEVPSARFKQRTADSLLDWWTSVPSTISALTTSRVRVLERSVAVNGILERLLSVGGTGTDISRCELARWKGSLTAQFVGVPFFGDESIKP